MAHSTIRLAAGAGVVAASMLIVGPIPAQAVADKNGSGSYFGNDAGGNRSNKPGSSAQPGRTPINDIRDRLDAIADPTPSTAPPLMDLGSGGSDLQGLTVPDSVEGFAITEGPVVMRTAAVEELPSVNATGAVPRSGSDYAGLPAASVRSPRVVVGNGRTPGTQVPDPVPALDRETWVTPEVAPAVPVAIEINIPPLPPPLPPLERIHPPRLEVRETGTAKIDIVTDPLAGLVGLILIPAVGAVLGYRQARAAHSRRESARA